MGNGRPETDEVDGVGHAASTSHLTLTDTAVVDAKLVARPGRAAYLGRLVYNAAADRRVPFAEGLAYRLRLGQAQAHRVRAARRTRQVDDLPSIAGSARDSQGTDPAGPRLPALRGFPRSLLDVALGEACRARAAYAKGCGAAKEAGRPMPDLRFRSADDGWAVAVDDFRVVRIGTDDARPAPKVRRIPRANGPKRDAALRAGRHARAQRRATGGTEGRARGGLGGREAPLRLERGPCLRFAAKDLRPRTHDCPCGFACDRDRDHASAPVTLGRAPLPFRESADPGGAIAQVSREATTRAAKARLGAERRAAGNAPYVVERRERTPTAGDRPRPPGRGEPRLPVPRPKHVRGSGRNVRRLAAGPSSD